MNIVRWICRYASRIALCCIAPMLSACGDNTISWQEEVRFLDGRVITVTQKRRIDIDRIPREAWLALKLPELGEKEVVWHESLETQVLNVYQGRLYVVGYPYTAIEFHKYGDPKPSYVGFRYDNGRWVRISFSEIPEAIYDTNMYFDNMASYRLSRVSLVDKQVMLKDETYMPHFKKVDPRWVLRAAE